MVAYFCKSLVSKSCRLVRSLWWLLSYICRLVRLLYRLVRKENQTNSLISCFCSVLLSLTAIYLSIWYLTSQHNDLISRHNCFKSLPLLVLFVSLIHLFACFSFLCFVFNYWVVCHVFLNLSLIFFGHFYFDLLFQCFDLFEHGLVLCPLAFVRVYVTLVLIL